MFHSLHESKMWLLMKQLIGVLIIKDGLMLRRENGNMPVNKKNVEGNATVKLCTSLGTSGS